MGCDMTVPCGEGLINLRVGAILLRDGRFLMASNARDPYLYSVGGRVQFGETAEQAIVREAEEETGVKIDIEDDGSVFIATEDAEAASKARRIIEGIAKDLQVGDVFTGKVVRIMSFGAFVEYAPGKDGMIHISKLANERVEKVEDVVNIGDELEVRVGEIDSQGRVNLVRNDIVYDDDSMPVRRPPRRDGDRDRRGGDRGGDRRPRRRD